MTLTGTGTNYTAPSQRCSRSQVSAIGQSDSLPLERKNPKCPTCVDALGDDKTSMSFHSRFAYSEATRFEPAKVEKASSDARIASTAPRNAANLSKSRSRSSASSDPSALRRFHQNSGRRRSAHSIATPCGKSSGSRSSLPGKYPNEACHRWHQDMPCNPHQRSPIRRVISVVPGMGADEEHSVNFRLPLDESRQETPNAVPDHGNCCPGYLSESAKMAAAQSLLPQSSTDAEKSTRDAGP